MKILDKYKTWLMGRGVSDKTVKTYMSILTSILKQLDIKKLNEEIVTKYLFKVREKYAPATVYLYKEVIKSLLSFLKKEIKVPIMVKSQTLKKIPKTLSEQRFREELIPLIPELFNKPLKVEAIITLFFYTGIRREELINLQRNDINLKECNAKIKGKGSKERIVYFPFEIKNTLNFYFENEPEEKNAFNTNET